MFRVRGLLLLVAAVLLAVAGSVHGQEQPRQGGALEVAMIGEPPSLDIRWTTAVSTRPSMDLQVVDWATLVQRRGKPEFFDVFSTFFVFTADPARHTSVQCNFPGWWCHEEKERLLGELARETDAKKRRALVEKVQTVFYEDVGRIKFGDYFLLDLSRTELRGYRAWPDMFFRNAWLAK